MAGEVITKTIKDTQLKEYVNVMYNNSIKGTWKNVSALEWDGSKWVDFPVEYYDGTSYTVLNQGKYQTTWFASWSNSYRYMNLSTSNDKHGTKYQRQDETNCGYTRGVQFMFQGWWSKDPNGRGASLVGFDSESIQKQLKNSKVERIEVYFRNLHACHTSINQEPIRKGHVWLHNKATKPTKIKRTEMFNDKKNDFLFSATWFRGPSLQRTDSIYRMGNKPILPNWTTGYGTGLLDWNRNANSSIVEGTGNEKKVWKVLDNSVAEKFKKGTAKGFAFFEGESDSLGDEYGYWGGATVTPAIYLAISTGNRIKNFNTEISWVPQLRITYTKLNP